MEVLLIYLAVNYNGARVDATGLATVRPRDDHSGGAMMIGSKDRPPPTCKLIGGETGLRINDWSGKMISEGNRVTQKICMVRRRDGVAKDQEIA